MFGLILTIIYFICYIFIIQYFSNIYLPYSDKPFLEKMQDWKMNNRSELIKKNVKAYKIAVYGFLLCLLLLGFKIIISKKMKHIDMIMFLSVLCIYTYTIYEADKLYTLQKSEAVSIDMLNNVLKLPLIMFGTLSVYGILMLCIAI